MKKLKYPYCPQCGALFEEEGTTNCRICHGAYRLVNGDADRRARYRNWAEFYKEQGFTRKERHAIPSFRHLLLGPSCRAVKRRVRRSKVRGGSKEFVEVWKEEALEET